MDPPNQFNVTNLQSSWIDGTIENQEEKSREGLIDGKLSMQNIQIHNLPPDDSNRDVQPPKTSNHFQKIEESETHSPDRKNNGDSPKNNGKETSNKGNLQNWENANQKASNDETNVMETKEYSTTKNFEKFRELRKACRFADKTKLIMDFYCKFGNATCILRPRRSGKSLSIDMLKEFFCLPKIDIESYDPITKEHKNLNRTSESIFEGTAIWDPSVRQSYFKEKGYGGTADSFIRDNMNKYPVVVIRMFAVEFSSGDTTKDIERKFFESVIPEAFAQFDYVLLIKFLKTIWTIKYGKFSKENIKNVYADYNFSNLVSTEQKIVELWDYFGERMNEEDKKFYRLYRQEPPYQDIETSLKFLTEYLKKFFGKKVIVLVDEHDSPALSLYEKMSFADLIKCKEAIKAIKRYSDIINSILKNVAKYNEDCTEKFLMFGISNCIVNAANSELNNLDVHDVFKTTYSDYFAVTQAEVNATVEKLFNVRTEHKERIISNIDLWYNGYYTNSSSPLYSIYSASLYINDCYEEYKSRGILPEEKDDKWIPKPSAKWTEYRTTSILNSYYNIGFKGDFNYFLSDLYFRSPSYYKGFEQDFVPFLEDPTYLDDRAKMMFHFLLHLGYLTQAEERKDEYFRIPNFEIYFVLAEQIDEYLGSIPQKYEIASEMSWAIIKEKFESFGKELLKGLFLYSRKFLVEGDKSLGIPKEEITIDYLLLEMLETIEMGGDYIVTHEHSTGELNKIQGGQKIGLQKHRDGGYSIGFHLEPTNEGQKIHYVIELKTKRDNLLDDIQGDAFDGLNRIFTKDDPKHILPSKDTKSIINIGLAANTTHLCLAILKVNIVNACYDNTENLKIMEFKIKNANDTNGEVIPTESWIIPLEFQDSPVVENATDADIKKAIDGKRQAISDQIILEKGQFKKNKKSKAK
jgi:hypothetical protein